MARRLGADKNEMTIQDTISDSLIVFYYRLPSNRERILYHQSLINTRGARVRIKSFETRLKFGMQIITGFRDGDFEIQRDGKWISISSDPNSSNFFPDWRSFIEENAPDLVVALATAVFEGATAVPEEEEEEGEIDESVPSSQGSVKNFRPSSLGSLVQNG